MSLSASSFNLLEIQKMKFRNLGRKFGAGLAVVGSTVGSAMAAVPAAVTTSLTDAQADGVAVATAVLVAIVAIYAFKLMRKGL